jgi:hypothetical protein
VLFTGAILVKVYVGGMGELAQRTTETAQALVEPDDATPLVFTYPGAGQLTAGPANCDMACMVSRGVPGFSAIFLGTGETGLYYAPDPPPGCLLVSLGLPSDRVPGITDLPAAVVFDGAPKAALEQCNPGTSLGDYAFGYRIPSWYRSPHAAIVSVPEEIFRRNLNYVVHACAAAEDGRVLEFFGDYASRVLRPSNDGICGPGDIAGS